MLAHVFPARADAYGFSEARKPRQFPFGKHVPISDVVSAASLVRRFDILSTRFPLSKSPAARSLFDSGIQLYEVH